jgi:hypothetical protein
VWREFYQPLDIASRGIETPGRLIHGHQGGQQIEFGGLADALCLTDMRPGPTIGPLVRVEPGAVPPRVTDGGRRRMKGMY